MRSHPLVHVFALLAVVAATAFPNLGTPALWDVDEGVNAGCTREMIESGTWVVPTFNGELRTAKPVMLYWLQRPSLTLFGPTEFAARLPAVLLAAGAVLLVYDLARRMFDAVTGLLAGVVLATSVEFCKLAHAATPDAPLVFFTTLTMFAVWVGHRAGGRGWFAPAAAACGLAVLTKGPVGVALPGLVVLLYFAWNRELRRVWDRRLLRGLLVFAAVAVPWYALVISETRGAYLAFFRNENANRFLNPMEGHRGPVVYYVGALFAFFAPWSVFLGGAVWYAVKGSRRAGEVTDDVRAHRLLVCWAAAYLVFFSAAATKLPNYIAPLYPAIAILTARFLVRWVRAEVAPARWVMPAAAVGLGIVGVCVGGGLLVAGGAVPLSMKGLRVVPGLAPWAAVGLIPAAAGVALAWGMRAGKRDVAVKIVSVAAVAFVGILAAFPPAVVDALKAPKALVNDAGIDTPGREIRLASLDYTQPSVTFYAGRAVERVFSADAATRFLAMPRPAYLFVPEPVWATQLAGKLPACRVAARRFDLYRNCEVLVIANGEAGP